MYDYLEYMDNKIENVLASMKSNDLNQLIICDSGSIYYLTGKMFHTGHRMLALVISHDKEPVLFIHEMFPTGKLERVKVHHWKDTDNYIKSLYEELDSDKNIGVDKFFEARYLLGLTDLGLKQKVRVGSFVIDDIRGVKSDEEILLMEKSSEINDNVMIKLQEHISNFKGDITENYLKEKLISFYKEFTNEGLSFDPIICFGGNAADPHHEIDDTILKENNCIVIDIGCMKDNYASDMTRTVFYKGVSDFDRNIYEIVKEANIRATNFVKPGVKFSEVDAVARDYITEKGYGEYFNHRLGHFIGMEVHEAGDVSGSNHSLVKEGMIFSIEPGIYIKDKGIGVRIENLVVVTKDGCRSLNKIPLDLKVL
ncbi:MAG: M24 family metallopeptidase [Lachnospirales bacterium]